MTSPKVLDEADKLLDLDLGPVIDKILKVIPKERTTYLFSATMTTKVAKLQRASLSNPVRVEVSSKYARLSIHALMADDSQVFHRVHTPTILPLYTHGQKRCEPRLFGEQFSLKFYHHLYENRS